MMMETARRIEDRAQRSDTMEISEHDN